MPAKKASGKAARKATLPAISKKSRPAASRKLPPVETAGGARISRAAARRVKRRSTAPAMGEHTTPFGQARLTDKKRGAGGFATTRLSDFKGASKASKTDGSYQQLLGMAEPETLSAVESASRKRSRSDSLAPPEADTSIKDIGQRRTAAHLSAIGLSEEQRHPAAPKSFRAGLRAALDVAKKGGGGEERAEALYKHFPQGAPASHRSKRKLSHATGARAYKKPTTGRAEDRRRAQSRDIAGGYLSESSDDE